MTEGLPTTQRAWHQVARGQPKDVLRLVKDASVPRPARNEILVKVHSVALNPIGYKLMSSVPWPIAKLPAIPESDFSGTVVDSNGHSACPVGRGESVDGSRRSNANIHLLEVLGFVDPFAKIRSGKGAMAEYIVVPADRVIHKPAKMTWSEAAGLSVVGLTAYQGIVTHGKLVSGQRVFINGGSSSVGSLAVQLAKQRGATVVTSCSGAKREFVQGLGADLVLDYTESPIASQLEKLDPFDLILDCIGTVALYQGSPKFLKPNGPYLTTGIDFHGLSNLQTVGRFLRVVYNATMPSFLGGVSRKFKPYGMEWNDEAMRTLAELVATRQIHLPIDGEYSCEKEDVIKAFDRQMSARARGKIIIQM